MPLKKLQSHSIYFPASQIFHSHVHMFIIFWHPSLQHIPQEIREASHNLFFLSVYKQLNDLSVHLWLYKMCESGLRALECCHFSFTEVNSAGGITLMSLGFIDPCYFFCVDFITLSFGQQQI